MYKIIIKVDFVYYNLAGEYTNLSYKTIFT